MAGQRVRSVRGTAVAAAAMAALTASQAPGAAEARASVPARETAEHGPSVSGDTPYRTDLPPLTRRHKGADAGTGTASAAGGAVPATVFAAYRHAEAELARTAPGCGLRWQLLAAIGRVESGQADGGRVTADGTTVTPILGPRLDGGAFAVVRDTDGGAYDGDAVYDRAVGPMQFIPSTWARWGADGNGDGRAVPGNVFDAALAAGRYLCAGGRDLSEAAGLDAAILGYNHSAAYLRTVRAWYGYFLEGHRVVPDGHGSGSGPAEATSRPSKRPKSAHPKSTAKPTPTPRSGASPSPAPASATPSNSPSAPGTSSEPVAPVPTPSIELPVGDVLPSTGL
ncbi:MULTISPECIES: lytic transglycosylase domain-containing protein [unclassified Streptomyces]|uniref:lytic transglycosylase domain-containing protein n=1 Tax=unclassified Streptomyces TaxID=2593676 RepID=UPI00225C192F|nr:MULTISPECIES: lytic transglycosylase domain-containing protein [unclassified Streptomyces]MCX5062334.1 lytic transglycosylase domain-containing protein [Streptomyces sp. NBC_00452]MCX5292058.1 lytic transglycosylase domain-containing protein [Streptomyces sp. NBC_00183]